MWRSGSLRATVQDERRKILLTKALRRQCSVVSYIYVTNICRDLVGYALLTTDIGHTNQHYLVHRSWSLQLRVLMKMMLTYHIVFDLISRCICVCMQQRSIGVCSSICPSLRVCVVRLFKFRPLCSSTPDSTTYIDLTHQST